MPVKETHLVHGRSIALSIQILAQIWLSVMKYRQEGREEAIWLIIQETAISFLISSICTDRPNPKYWLAPLYKATCKLEGHTSSVCFENSNLIFHWKLSSCNQLQPNPPIENGLSSCAILQHTDFATLPQRFIADIHMLCAHACRKDHRENYLDCGRRIDSTAVGLLEQQSSTELQRFSQILEAGLWELPNWYNSLHFYTHSWGCRDQQHPELLSVRCNQAKAATHPQQTNCSPSRQTTHPVPPLHCYSASLYPQDFTLPTLILPPYWNHYSGTLNSTLAIWDYQQLLGHRQPCFESSV